MMEELYEVEKILSHKVSRGTRLYFIKWLNFPESDNTWEPEENLVSCKSLVDQYNENIKGKMKKAKTKGSFSIVEMDSEEANTLKDKFWQNLEMGKVDVFNTDMYSRVKKKGKDSLLANEEQLEDAETLNESLRKRRHCSRSEDLLSKRRVKTTVGEDVNSAKSESAESDGDSDQTILNEPRDDNEVNDYEVKDGEMNDGEMNDVVKRDEMKHENDESEDGDVSEEGNESEESNESEEGNENEEGNESEEEDVSLEKDEEYNNKENGEVKLDEKENESNNEDEEKENSSMDEENGYCTQNLIVTSSKQYGDSRLNGCISALKHQIVSVLGSQVNLLKPMFSAKLYHLQDMMNLEFVFNHCLLPLGPGSGHLLFVAVAGLTANSLLCRLHGLCPVKAAFVNNIPLEAIQGKGKFIFSFTPLNDGVNMIRIDFHSVPKTKAMIIVAAYRISLKTDRTAKADDEKS